MGLSCVQIIFLTQPVSLGTKLNQSKIADMPWQLQMNLWPIMKWFPVCMAYKIIQIWSLLSHHMDAWCAFSKDHFKCGRKSPCTWPLDHPEPPGTKAHIFLNHPKQFHFIQRIQRQSTSCIFRLYIKAKSGGSSAGALFELKQYIFLSNTSYLLPLSSRESCLVRHAVGHHDLWSTQLVLADQHPD